MRSRFQYFVFWALVAVFSLAQARDANAHVKWFCAFDVSSPPRELANVLCFELQFLVALGVLAILTGCAIEDLTGASLTRALDRITSGIRRDTDLLVRAALGFFLVSSWVLGGVLLTPELKTSSPVVPWVQLALAFGLLWRGTLVFTAAGIIVLYAIALRTYGAFHLADYPIFVGIAGYLALIGFKNDLPVRPIDVLRWAGAVTLMWASVEKWAYPEWSFPLLIEHPGMAMGYEPEFYMRAAGVVEFSLAFALVWTPLVRRSAAIMLSVAFLTAVLEFGKLDAIGHAPIVAALLGIAADDAARSPRRSDLLLAPASYALALAVTIGAYYGLHAILFPARLS